MAFFAAVCAGMTAYAKVETWEVFPEEQLAVVAEACVPEKPTNEAVIFMNDRVGWGNAASKGAFSVFVDLPGLGTSCLPEVDEGDSRRRYLHYFPDSGWDEAKLIEAEVACLEERIKAHSQFLKGGMIRFVKNETVPPSAKPKKVRRLSEYDFRMERSDGRTVHAAAWSLAKLRQRSNGSMKPTMLKDGKAFREYLERGRYYQEKQRFGDDVAELTCEFKLLKDESRKGYRLLTYEFYPFEGLAVKTMMCVPDVAEKGRTPLMVCMPGTAGSLESLVGEPDPFTDETMHPLRERQCWWYAQVGIIGVGLENPANANNSLEGIRYYKSQAKWRQYAGKFKVNGHVMTEEYYDTAIVSMVINFMKKNSLVDPERIGVSGMSLGCMTLGSALANPNVKAMVYNDFNRYGAGWRQSVTHCRSDELHGGVWGDGGTPFMLLPPKWLLLNEAAAWKNNTEAIVEAYRLAGCPERLAIHRYDRYQRWNNYPMAAINQQDMRDARDYSAEDAFKHDNCDYFDHSFHAEAAVPWICRVFWGDESRITDELKIELLRAHAELRVNDYDRVPPKAPMPRNMGPLDREITDDMLVPERPDGRTEKTCTWAKMMADRARIEN